MPLVTNDTGKKDDLVKASALTAPAAVINTPQITSPDYRSIAVDTRWVPRTNLLTHIEGSPWSVDYYSQVLDTDSQLSGQQTTLSAVYQQYTKIVGMEMRVTSALSTSQDDATKAMTLSGSATTYPFIIPNDGDMFVADVGEGVRGIFRITSTLKKSIFKEACYEISYSLDNTSTEKLIDLNEKTVKTVFYHKDYLSFGQNPLLTSSAHEALLELDKVYTALTRQYFKRFFSREYQTLLVPGQTRSVYDPFLVDFVLSIFSTWDSPEIRQIRKLNVDDDEVMRCDSLWRALKEKDMTYLNTAFKRAGLAWTGAFTKDPVFNGIRYTGIHQVVYPLDTALTVDGMLVNPVKSTLGDVLVPSTTGAATMVRADNLQAIPSGLSQGVYPVTIDDHYVLSQDFYNKTSTQSTLEGLVWTYLQGERLDAAQLIDTAKRFTQWGVLEQFYYVPIIMLFIRSVKQGL